MATSPIAAPAQTPQPLQMTRKEFDAMAASLRFDLPELWRRQSVRNGELDRRIMLMSEDHALQAKRIAELEYRVDVLTRAVSGGIAAAQAERELVRGLGEAKVGTNGKTS